MTSSRLIAMAMSTPVRMPMKTVASMVTRAMKNSRRRKTHNRLISAGVTSFPAA